MNAEVDPPQTLDGVALEYLKRKGKAETRTSGTVLLKRGDPVSALYTILSGIVEVRLGDGEGAVLTLARLGPGSAFGEMGLATGAPASADVVAATPVDILELPERHFFEGMAECESLRLYILRKLAAGLRQTSLEAWKGFQRNKVLTVLARPKGWECRIVAESGRMKRVLKRLEERAADAEPVLLIGGPGAGKAFMAAWIHHHSSQASDPLVVVDCRSLPEEEAQRILLGDSEIGKGRDNLQVFGAVHAAHGGTLVLRQLERLPQGVQRSLADFLNGLEGGGETSFPRFRLVATATVEGNRAEAPGSLDTSLRHRFQGRMLEVPPLSERRGDVLPLVLAFLEEFSQGRPLALAKEAEHALLSQKFDHGNVEELKEAVRLAALFAGEGPVRAEHIFAGPKQAGSGREMDLTRWLGLRWLLAGDRLERVRQVGFLVFLTVTGLCLAWGTGLAGSLSNQVIWGLWEPALIGLYLLTGRAWCAMCPLAVAGRLAKRLGPLERPPPRWMKKGGVLLAAFGFAAILLSERVFNMVESPRASAVLLLSLAGLAILFGWVYQRETWCRYLCPLGTLGAAFSAPGVLLVRANPAVCGADCTTHDCFKGTPSKPGCPVFHHPLYASDSHSCRLCLNCLQVCPHGSARLYGRVPLRAIWAQLGLSGVLTPFSLSVFFLSICLLAVQVLHVEPGTPLLAAGSLLCVLLGALSGRILPRLLARDREAAKGATARAASAFMVLAWGPLTAYQAGHVPFIRELVLLGRQGGFLERVLPQGGMAALPLLQIGAVAAAFSFAALVLGALERRLERDGVELRRWGWTVLQAAGAAYAVLAILILVA
ncbi:MAG: cyclic nucleotide-binding domain-containing protein [Acidobacteriota bacterium]